MKKGRRVHRAIELSSADDRNQSRGTSQIFMCLFETVIKVNSTCATCIICKQWKTRKSALKFVFDTCTYKRNANGFYSENRQSHGIHDFAK